MSFLMHRQRSGSGGSWSVASGILMLLFAQGPTLLRAATPDVVLSRKDLVDGLIARSQKLHDSQLTFTLRIWESEKPDAVVLNRAYEVIRSGEKVWMHRRDAKAPYNPTARDAYATWDGQRSMGYNENRDVPPQYRFDGLIAADEGPSVRTPYWRCIAREELPNAQVSIADAVQRGTWVILGAKRIGSYEAWGLASTEVLGDAAQTNATEIWVVPDHGFAPVRTVETVSIAGTKPMRVVLDQVELRPVEDTWAIGKAEITISNANVRPHPQIVALEVSRLGLGIPPGTQFAITFPVGTVVWDDILQTGYVAGKVVFMRQPDRTVGLRPISEFPEFDRFTDYSKGLSDAEWQQTSWGQAKPRSLTNQLPAANLPAEASSSGDPKSRLVPAPSARGVWVWMLTAGLGVLSLAGYFLYRAGKGSSTK